MGFYSKALLSAGDFHDGIQASWVVSAFNGFDAAASRRDFPCTLGVAAHRRDLIRFGVIQDQHTDDAPLATILEEYLHNIAQLPPKEAGLAALVVFINVRPAIGLYETHSIAWQYLNQAMLRDRAPWPAEVSRDSGGTDFVFCFGGEQWFVNVSSPAHCQRQSRNLGPALVLAMQPLSASNGYFASTSDKITSQRVIRDRTHAYDGMPVYEGLGLLIGEGTPRPLVESYFLPDTNDTKPPQCWRAQMAKRFEYVLFDFDGTLVDSAECGIKATQLAFVEAGLAQPSCKDIVRYMGIPIETSFRKMSSKFLPDSEFAALLVNFRAHYKTIAELQMKAFDGIVSMLTALKSNSQKIGVVTSKLTEAAIRNAEQVGIAHLLDAIIGSDLVSECKPDPETVFTALHALGAHDTNEPSLMSKVIVVGDATFDLQMGRAAGATTCAVTWGAYSHAELAEAAPDHIVSSVADLLLLLLQTQQAGAHTEVSTPAAVTV